MSDWHLQTARKGLDEWRFVQGADTVFQLSSCLPNTKTSWTFWKHPPIVILLYSFALIYDKTYHTIIYVKRYMHIFDYTSHTSFWILLYPYLPIKTSFPHLRNSLPSARAFRRARRGGSFCNASCRACGKPRSWVRCNDESSERYTPKIDGLRCFTPINGVFHGPINTLEN